MNSNFNSCYLVLYLPDAQTGVDLTEELQKSFDKKTKRDSERHKNNPKLSEHQEDKEQEPVL